MERNSDVVLMASYAPLFANVNYKKWNPDLIDFDSSRVYGLPSYYVQKMFSENRGEVILPGRQSVTRGGGCAKVRRQSGSAPGGRKRNSRTSKLPASARLCSPATLQPGTAGWALHGGGLVGPMGVCASKIVSGQYPGVCRG